MKKIILLLAGLTFLALSSYGQAAKGGQVAVTPKPADGRDATGGQGVVIAKPVERPTTEKTIPLIPLKMTNAVWGKRIAYDGYFMQMLRAENKRALFDLGTPPDPQKDSGNVFFNSRRDIAQPVVLFRIKF